MASVYPLVQVITRLSAASSVMSPWEECALNFIEKNRPLSVFFICDISGQYCPANSLYKKMEIPSQTFFGLETNELPLFHHDDMVFYVNNRLVDWNEQTVEKYRLGGKTDFKLVVVAKSHGLGYDFESMEDLFAAMWLSGIVQCAVLLVNGTSTQIYTYFPYKNKTSCEDTTPVLLGECSKGPSEVFSVGYEIFNLNQCPLRIGLSPNRLNNSLYGETSPLIREIVSQMNARIEFMIPNTDGSGGICGPTERLGLRGMVYNGTVHLAFTSFNQRECATLEYVGMGYTQCYSWCTPVLSASDYVYTFLVNQLQPGVWLGLIMSVLTVSVSVLVFCAVLHEDWTTKDVFQLTVTMYAQMPPPKLRATPPRIIAAVWLWACLVFRAAYEGEMKSQSSAYVDSYIIQDVDGLLNANILLCLPKQSSQIFKAVDDDPDVQRVYKKSTICKENSNRNVVLAAQQKDRAVFTLTGNCIDAAYQLSRDKALLYPRTGGCFKVSQMSPIATVRSSPFIEKWSTILNRCFQSGLIMKWLNRKSFPKGRSRSHRRLFSFKHILPALFVLGLGSLGGLLLLICEKTYYKWHQRKPRSSYRGYK